jgi:hypothetical protein
LLSTNVFTRLPARLAYVQQAPLVVEGGVVGETSHFYPLVGFGENDIR